MAGRPLAPVRWTTIGAAALLGGAVGRLGWILLDALGHRPPPPSWLVAGGLALLGGLALVGARFAHQRFHVLHRLPQPSRGLALVASAKTAIVGGAALAGAYLVLALANLPQWAIEAARSRVVRGAVTAAAALLLLVGGKVLERECRTEHPGSSDR